MGIKFPSTEYTEQEILNMGLDSIDVAPTSLRGGLVWAEGMGWIRAPVGGNFPYEQIEYDGSSQPIYMGYNTDIAAADGATDWIIYKLTWVSDNMTVKKMRITSWTLRASGW